MPRLAVEPPKEYTIVLSQNEANHLTVALGGYNQDDLNEHNEDTHKCPEIANNHELYLFFLQLSESRKKKG
jgi:hypothetical protein